MKKLFIPMLLIMMTVGCGHADPDKPAKEPDPEVEYVFHDGFYYFHDSESDGKVYLTPCEDEYMIAFKADDAESVLNYIDANGYVHLQEHPGIISNTETELPELWRNYMVVWIKGSKEILELPEVFYSCQIYDRHKEPASKIFDPESKFKGKFFPDGGFAVFLDDEHQEDMLNKVMQYAEDFNAVLNYVTEYPKTVRFMCMPDSPYNPVEIANWFCEVAGFDAEPISLNNSSGFD